MYVKKAIENLLLHKDIKRSSHHELKVACEEALKAIEASNNNSTSESGEHFEALVGFEPATLDLELTS